jgi:hypothetical protein
MSALSNSEQTTGRHCHKVRSPQDWNGRVSPAKAIVRRPRRKHVSNFMAEKSPRNNRTGSGTRWGVVGPRWAQWSECAKRFVNDNNGAQDEKLAIQIGYAVAPLPLNTAGLDPDLVGWAATS